MRNPGDELAARRGGALLVTLFLLAALPVRAAPQPAGAAASAVSPDPEEPPPPWRALLGTAAGTAAGFAVVHTAGILLMGVVALPVLAVSVPGALDANPGACLAVICLVTPLQLSVATLGTLAGTILAVSSAWAAGTLGGRRRVPLPALLAGVALPSWSSCAVGAGLNALAIPCHVTCATCGTMVCMNFLVDRYQWPNTHAEYYAMRRVAPPIFYGCWAASQAAMLATLVTGNLVGAGAAAWMVRQADPWEPGQDPLDLEDLDFLDPGAMLDGPGGSRHPAPRDLEDD